MTEKFFDFVGVILVATLSIPTVIYAAECVLGSLPVRRHRPAGDYRPPVTVLVPAHNEESGLAATLVSINSQLRKGDRLVVVADNCEDRTAALARAAGAEVVERWDETRRGKGFALDAGIRFLKQTPPEIVILIDADCQLGRNAIDTLAGAVIETGKPVQSRYLLVAPPGGALNLAVAEFAFLVKNRVRPLGLSKLRLPCQLTGSGMAFPWAILEQADLAHANLVEDMKLGLDLARAGHPPQFCDQAIVTSDFPLSSRGMESQRHRWETGHLALTLSAMRHLFSPASFRHPASLALILDVMTPPLTLLVFLLLAALLAGGIVALAGAPMSGTLGLAAFNISLLVAATLSAWVTHGQRALPAPTLRRIPLYVLWKLGLYLRSFLMGERKAWIRTERKNAVEP